MGRMLVMVILLGVAVAGVVWAMQRVRDRAVLAPPARLDARPAVSTAVLQERATLAYGPDRGPGLLRLTDSQLVFTADSGRVLAIERLDIVGVTVTRSLPDREVTRPVLAVTTPGDTSYFAVRSAGQWESQLT